MLAKCFKASFDFCFKKLLQCFVFRKSSKVHSFEKTILLLTCFSLMFLTAIFLLIVTLLQSLEMVQEFCIVIGTFEKLYEAITFILKFYLEASTKSFNLNFQLKA